MRQRWIILLLAFCSLSATHSAAWQGPRASAGANTPAGPPKTEIHEVKETIFGVEITDPYRWLEDQSSPETRAWIDAQNAYTNSFLKSLPARDALKENLASMLKIDTMSAPAVRSGRYFFSKRQADQDQGLLYMRKGLTGK